MAKTVKIDLDDVTKIISLIGMLSDVIAPKKSKKTKKTLADANKINEGLKEKVNNEENSLDLTKAWQKVKDFFGKTFTPKKWKGKQKGKKGKK